MISFGFDLSRIGMIIQYPALVVMSMCLNGLESKFSQREP